MRLGRRFYILYGLVMEFMGRSVSLLHYRGTENQIVDPVADVRKGKR